MLPTDDEAGWRFDFWYFDFSTLVRSVLAYGKNTRRRVLLELVILFLPYWKLEGYELCPRRVQSMLTLRVKNDCQTSFDTSTSQSTRHLLRVR